MVSVVNRFLLKVLTLGLVFADAEATEGAMGRPLTGMQITPFSGLVPATPGMQWSFGYLHYTGDIGASRQVPIAGRVSLGLKADIDLVAATGDGPGALELCLDANRALHRERSHRQPGYWRGCSQSKRKGVQRRKPLRGRAHATQYRVGILIRARTGMP